MFTLKSLTIIFTSQNKDVPTEFLLKAVEVTERLDDENQENREEAVRCLGALLHFITEKMKQTENQNKTKSLVDLVKKILARLILHMDDESEVFRDIVLGCIITLPTTLDEIVQDTLEKAKEKQIHQEPINQIIEKISVLHVTH